MFKMKYNTKNRFYNGKPLPGRSHSKEPLLWFVMQSMVKHLPNRIQQHQQSQSKKRKLKAVKKVSLTKKKRKEITF